ncbi:MAG TPA: VOC family protein [Polyangiaceae bacterium]|nr:VOC family protein [Polyangiaceae bacterium]
MKPKIKVLTLAVSDLERSLAFYRDGLGFPTDGIVGEESTDDAVVLFPMSETLILALSPVASLARDARITPTSSRLGAVAIGHAVGSNEEVDATMNRATSAGGVVTDPAKTRSWGGYSGFFHDPDGHLWQVAYHPEWDEPAD